MPCYHPIAAWHLPSGDIKFAVSGDQHHKPLKLHCGQCIGCRLERSRQWAIRCMHEAKMHQHNCFLTITYADEHLPGKYFTGLYHPKTGEKIYSGTLSVIDTQLFLKRLRKSLGIKVEGSQSDPTGTDNAPSTQKLRFYLGGEYGEQYGRPHYHICLFGIDFPDKIYLGKSQAGHRLYTSETVTKTWNKGLHSIGELTFESAAYTARYMMKKITGDKSEKHYEKIDIETGEIRKLKPEFNTMSRGGREKTGGIGQAWLAKYMSDVYPTGKVHNRGTRSNAPRYYDKQYEKHDPFGYEILQMTKHLEGRQHIADQTPARLKVREEVTKATVQLLRRKI